MPKVSEKYLTDKRNYILECTGEILKEKPLYSVTMREIIKKAGGFRKAGFSQGMLHYYACLDDVYEAFEEIKKHNYERESQKLSY